MEKLVRRPNAVILFISLSLLMMLTTGCQEIKLKAGIEAANKQCPIDMGETCLLYTSPSPRDRG